MNFQKRIADHVYLHWDRMIGALAIVLDDWPDPLLDLTELTYKEGHNKEMARSYVGRQLCEFLKTPKPKERLLNDYWMNQYLEREEILKAIETVTANAANVK